MALKHCAPAAAFHLLFDGLKTLRDLGTNLVAYPYGGHDYDNQGNRKASASRDARVVDTLLYPAVHRVTNHSQRQRPSQSRQERLGKAKAEITRKNSREQQHQRLYALA